MALDLQDKDYTIRDLVNMLDEISKEIKYQVDNIDADTDDLQIYDVCIHIEDEVTDYQSNKGWI